MEIRRLFAALWVLCAPAASGAQERRPPAAFLPTGTMLRVTITNAIFSYNLETPVIAELDGPAVFAKRDVLPDKTKLLGRALVLKSSDRINIDFSLAVLPDGREILISALALSPDGSAGIRGAVKKHKDSAVASAALRGAIQGTAAAASASVLNPIVSEASQAAVQETVKEIDLAREQVDTSISVPAFTRCLVYLSRRLEMTDEASSLERRP